MSETKQRTLEEVQNQFNQLCFNAGRLQYQISALSKDLDVLNNTLRDLNFEAAALKPSQTETKKDA